MANSKIGWCEALLKSGHVTRKVVTGKNGRESYKYYNSDGKQLKRTDEGTLNIKKNVKEELHTKTRAYNREQLHKTSIVKDVDEIVFASKEDKFSDTEHWN